MRLNEFYLLYMNISWHKYARLRTIFDFMTKLLKLWRSSKLKKNQIRFLKDREVIGPQIKKINCSTFLKLWFEPKMIQTPTWRHFCKKKLKIIFFLPSRGARELKLLSFESEAKTKSVCFRKNTPNSLFSFYHYF